MIGSTLGKIANEVFTLQKTETAELEECSTASQSYSSTMPHKRNPPDSERVVALSKVVCHSVPLALEGMIVEHERDRRADAIEEFAEAQACINLGEILQRSRNILRDLIVKPDKMRANLDIQEGFLLSEAVMLEMAKNIGRQAAHNLVRQVSSSAYKQGISFKEALMKDPDVTNYMDEAKIDELLDPKNYLGVTSKLTRDMVALTKKERHKFGIDY
jgi:adenylosuccinate lyase